MYDNTKDIFDIIDLIDESTSRSSVKIQKEVSPSPTPITQIKSSSKLIEIKSAYDYIGGEIHYKIAVQNLSESVITDIHLTLVPSAQYEISERVKVITLLKPNESRGVDFSLVPLTCGKSKIFGSCYFMDAQSNPYTITIDPKEIWIKCPLVEPKKTTLTELEQKKRGMQKGKGIIPIIINEQSAFEIMIDQISALDLSEVMVDNLKGVYSGIAKITNDPIIIESEIKSNSAHLTVWTTDLKQATGFLAYLKNLITIAFENASKMEGKVEAICQKILGSSDVIQRFISLFNYCEENWSLNESLTLLKEIQRKLQKRNPESPIIKDLQKWVEQLESYVGKETSIPENISIDLQFQILNWITELNKVVYDNLETYERTFPEQKFQIQQLSKIIQEETPLILEIEKKYTRRILKYLLLIEKESGVCLFEFNFTESVINPNLIGGFLTAIQDIGTEFSDEETAMTKLAYKNFEIVLDEKDIVRGALFLKGSPTDEVWKKFHLFIANFEKEFEEFLENWEGKDLPPGAADSLVKKIFVEKFKPDHKN